MTETVITDTNDAIRQVTRYGAIRAKAVEIVQEGPWRGVWADACVWHESDNNPFEHIIGYVRIVTTATDVECVTYRQNSDDDDTLRRLYVSAEKSLMSQLRSACEILLLMHLHDRMPSRAECSAMSEFDTKCTAPSLHTPSEPAHVDETGHVWY